jgi:hypothetical protein
MNQSRTPRRIEKRATSGHGHMDSCGCRSGWEKSGAQLSPLPCARYSGVFGGSERPRKKPITPKAMTPMPNAKPNPLQNVSHLHLRSLRGWSRQTGDRFILRMDSRAITEGARGLSPASPPLEERKLFGRARPMSGSEKLRTRGKRESQVAASGVARPPLALQPYAPHRRSSR